MQCLAKTLISDELASDAGTDHLVHLLGQLHVSDEPAVDLESVGSTDPMPVDSDTASYNTFPTNVTIYNDPLPQADGCDAVTTEVMVVGHGGLADESDTTPHVRRPTTCPLPSRLMPTTKHWRHAASPSSQRAGGWLP